MKSKKILLSSFVVLVFVACAVSLRLNSNFFWEREDDARVPITTTQPTPQTPPPVVPPPAVAQGQYKDGQYTGTNVDVYYGYVQVAAVIQGGKITDVKFLNYPSDRRTSLEIANYSLPILKTEAISVQSANVNTVSGATETSKGFRESLASALAQAK